jgi:hypothetical protein
MPAKTIKSRDYFLKAIILGSVKAGIVPDYRKHTNKFACRRKQMPAAVLAHAPTSDVVVDWERDTDLFRVYADVYTLEDGSQDIIILDMHMLDETLQPEAVINTSMFNADEWENINASVIEEWGRMNDAG